MIRTLNQNSTEETKTSEMEKLKKNFEKSGYAQSELEKIQKRAIEQTTQERLTNEDKTLTFLLFYFDGLYTFNK